MAIVPHPTTTLDETRLRAVLAAPRGHRFSRPGSSRPTAARARANSATAPRLIELWPEHTLPESPQARQERLLRQVEGSPRAAYTLEHGAVPHGLYVARQQREQTEREVREAASAAKEPVPAPPRGRHRAPRRWWAWPAVAIGAALLFGQTAAEAVGQKGGLAAGFLL